MLGIMFFCAGFVGFVVIVSMLIEFMENCRKDYWRTRVTAEDIEELKRLFETEGSFVGYNEKGEKFLVGYHKD